MRTDRQTYINRRFGGTERSLISQAISYNVTLRRILANTVVVEKRWILNILSVCSLRYPACNAHAPNCHLCPARLYSIFPHYLIISTMCVFWFPLQILSETFLVLRRTGWDFIKNVYWSSCEVPFILVRL